MTKEEIIQKMKELNLPRNSYVVFGSAPLAFAGLREANDIDLLVSPDVFSHLKESGWKEMDKGGSDRPLTFDVFEAHENWNFSSYSPSLEDLQSRTTEIEGVPIASLEDVKKWKQSSGRPKDLNDLALIEQFQNKF